MRLFRGLAKPFSLGIVDEVTSPVVLNSGTRYLVHYDKVWTRTFYGGECSLAIDPVRSANDFEDSCRFMSGNRSWLP